MAAPIVRPKRPLPGVTRVIARPGAPVVRRLAPRAPEIVPTPTRDADAAEQARFEALIAELQALRGAMNRAVYRSGQILRELSTANMLARAQVPDFERLLERYDLPTRFTALKYIAVADAFDEAQATTLGVERGYAIVRAAAAMPSPMRPRALLAQNPQIDVGPEKMGIASAPLRAVLGWVDGLTPSAAPPPRRAFKEADSVRDKLARRFASTGVGKPKMRLVARGGAYAVRMEMSVAEAGALLAAVRKST